MTWHSRRGGGSGGSVWCFPINDRINSCIQMESSCVQMAFRTLHQNLSLQSMRVRICATLFHRLNLFFILDSYSVSYFTIWKIQFFLAENQSEVFGMYKDISILAIIFTNCIHQFAYCIQRQSFLVFIAIGDTTMLLSSFEPSRKSSVCCIFLVICETWVNCGSNRNSLCHLQDKLLLWMPLTTKYMWPSQLLSLVVNQVFTPWMCIPVTPGVARTILLFFWLVVTKLAPPLKPI